MVLFTWHGFRYYPLTEKMNVFNEFFAWFGKEPRPGFTKAAASARRVALEGRSVQMLHYLARP